MRIITSVNRDHYYLAWTLGQTVQRWQGCKLVVYDLDNELPEADFLEIRDACDLAEYLGDRPPLGFYDPHPGRVFALHKPMAIRRALADYPDELIVWLDADMLQIGKLEGPEFELADDVVLMTTIRRAGECPPERVDDGALNNGIMAFSPAAAPLVNLWIERTAEPGMLHDQQAICIMLTPTVDWGRAMMNLRLGRTNAWPLVAEGLKTHVLFTPTLRWNYYYQPMWPPHVPPLPAVRVLHFKSLHSRVWRMQAYENWCKHLGLLALPASSPRAGEQ